MTPSLLRNLLRNTELRQMLDFVSPAFWKVVPPGEVWGVGKELVQNLRDRNAISPLQSWLSSQEGLGVSIGQEGQILSSVLETLSEETRTQLGERVLRLYFAQLLECDDAILDLSPDAFRVPGEATRSALYWSPKRYRITWPSTFIDGLRNVYRGFYQDDEERFDRGLSALNLQPARASFLRHFGDDQTSLHFRTGDLVNNLHDSFVACQQGGQRLSGAFLALGFYLTTLYQTLELLDVPLDVRRAFTASQHPEQSEADADRPLRPSSPTR